MKQVATFREGTLRTRRLRLFRRLFTFGIVSVLATVVDLSLFNVFLGLDLLPPVPATTVAYTVGLVVSFVLNRSVTFRSGGRDRWTHEMAIFALISVIGLALNNGAVALVADLTREDTVALNVARIAAAATTWFLKFFLIQRWVFPEGPPPAPGAPGSRPPSSAGDA